jgi:hypothetical protein
MTFSAAASEGDVLFGTLAIPEREAVELSDEAVVRRLVASGVSRLTAERIVSIERAAESPSRARSRPQSRR